MRGQLFQPEQVVTSQPSKVQDISGMEQLNLAVGHRHRSFVLAKASNKNVSSKRWNAWNYISCFLILCKKNPTWDYVKASQLSNLVLTAWRTAPSFSSRIRRRPGLLCPASSRHLQGAWHGIDTHVSVRKKSVRIMLTCLRCKRKFNQEAERKSPQDQIKHSIWSVFPTFLATIHTSLYNVYNHL